MPADPQPLVPARDIALHEWNEQYANLIKATVLRPSDREATNVELALFAEQVQRTGLNPFLGQIHAVYRYDKRAGGEVMRVQVGIDGFRLIAERTGRYEGQTPVEWADSEGNWTDVWIKASEKPYAARVGVYKAGRREPTVAVAHWGEYAQTDRNGKLMGRWEGGPANQIAKCAEALALRKAFPAELSGLYTPEEMAQAEQRIRDEERLRLDRGKGTGQAEGIPLPKAVEDIITRATELGHAGLADRGAVEMAVGEQPEPFVERWVREQAAILDLMQASGEETVTGVVVDE